jgi:hypothetical protein
MAHAQAQPMKVRTYDPEQGCYVLSVYGFAAIQDGRRVGPYRRRFREARADARDHNAQARAQKQA